MGRSLSLALILCLLLSCSHTGDSLPLKASFETLGVRVYGGPFKNPLRLYGPEGDLILAYPSLRETEVLLIFSWNPGERYRLEVGKRILLLKAPEKRPLLRLLVFSPLGQSPQEFYLPGDLPHRFELLGEKDSFEVALMVESLSQEEIEISFADQKAHLRGEFSRAFLKRRILFEGEPTKVLPLRISGPLSLKTDLLFSCRSISLKKAIEVVSWVVPTDAYGFVEAHREKDTLVAPVPVWERLGYWLGIKAVGYSRFEPFAFQTVTLRNRLKAPLTVLLSSDFLDKKTREPVSGFYPRRFGPTGGDKKGHCLCRVAPSRRGPGHIAYLSSRFGSPWRVHSPSDHYPLGTKRAYC
ncbi:hypothetical protein [Thermosulfuriphilus sp.]